MVSKETWLPSFKELKVPTEINLTTPYLRAAVLHMHAYCAPKCYEFELCRQEEMDPRKCISEGRDVTNCGVEFLQKVKKNCRKSYDDYASCIEHRGGGRFLIARCRPEQREFDACLWDKLNIDRPPLGATSKMHLHSPMNGRPVPESKIPDYKKEAAKVTEELPHAVIATRDHYTNVKGGALDWFSDI